MKILRLLICLFIPSNAAVFILKIFKLGKIGEDVEIGFSIIFVDKLKLDDNTKIGHLNFIKIQEFVCKNNVRIGYLNFIRGPFNIVINKSGAIGNRNVVVRAVIGVVSGISLLKIGESTKITSSHKIDLTSSVTIGNYSILAGIGSQLWTHGYYHDRTGPGRCRVDGEIMIGDNVYVGSSCIFSHGVKVSNGITIGANSTVSKNLKKVGLYVSQQLRFIEFDPKLAIERLEEVRDENLCEKVYVKKNTFNDKSVIN